MKCVAIRKDGTPCCWSASNGLFCRVHANMLPKLRSRVARQERAVAETRQRIADLEEQAKVWEGNPS